MIEASDRSSGMPIGDQPQKNAHLRRAKGLGRVQPADDGGEACGHRRSGAGHQHLGEIASLPLAW